MQTTMLSLPAEEHLINLVTNDQVQLARTEDGQYWVRFKREGNTLRRPTPAEAALADTVKSIMNAIQARQAA